ncbi:MAG: glycosyltransferase family 4 protein [Bacteroidales bacterium]|nr:glycosyltransferase family 4 protein [Bacteroidales bacterium]
MNIIFLTMSPIQSIEGRNIYSDLIRKFRDEGHRVTIVSPRERKTGIATSVVESDGVKNLGVQTLNLTKTNVVEKGIGQILVKRQFKRAIKKYIDNTKFDLILYSTPPITLMGVVKYLKKKNPQAISYLLLKDIFPQNAVDIGMFGKNSVFYKYFRKKEIELYRQSDYIGCMSSANVEFVLKHNLEVAPSKVEVAPNSIELNDNLNDNDNKERIRGKYGLPIDKPVFVYGGNLGKPQGIPFLVKCLDANKNRTDCHFVVVGSGTEKHLIQEWYDKNKPGNATILQFLPKEDYDILVQSCDVGLIFLDHRFTIPNFPSRLLSYLEYKMPVICATDPNCDMGPMAEANGFGYWCESNSIGDFTNCVDRMLHNDIKAMGEKGYRFLCDNYRIENTYDTIMNHLKK